MIGTEYIFKETGAILTVISISVPRPTNIYHRNNVFVECYDGNTYHHTDIR